MSSICNFNIKRFSHGSNAELIDNVAVEEPLEISIAWSFKGELSINTISITMRTPGNDKELALGFLFTEGILSSFQQIKRVIQAEQNKICVFLEDELTLDIERLNRHFYTSSSCGVCGKSSIDAIRTVAEHVEISGLMEIKSSIIFSLNEQVKAEQKVFESTGGLHASALFNEDGKLLAIREDVGRHNALDKLIGANFMQNSIPLDNKILFLSGRASFELIQKAIMARIPVVCALGAPSSLAIELAREFNITLLGFLKDNSFNLYSSYHRISE